MKVKQSDVGAGVEIEDLSLPYAGDDDAKYEAAQTQNFTRVGQIFLVIVLQMG